MDLLEAVQIAALQAVFRHKERKSNPLDTEYGLRRIFRWYSEKFYTPLADVDGLPLDDVLQAYWECHYEDMDEKDIEMERQRLIEDEDDLRQRQIEEDENEVEVFEIAKEEMEIQKAAETVTKSLEHATQAIKDSPIAGYESHHNEARLVHSAPAMSPLPDIKMSFATEDEVDLDADTFGLLANPKVKK